MSRIVAAVWDCQFCSAHDIDGRHDACPQCGRPRDSHTRLRRAEHARVVTDPNEINDAQSGPDWICSSCGRTNSNKLSSCEGCGNTRAAKLGSVATSDFVPTEELIDSGNHRDTAPEWQASISDAEQADARSRRSFGMGRNTSRVNDQKPDKQRKNPLKISQPLLIIAAIALLLAGIGWGVYYTFIQTHDIHAEVSGFSWSRSIEVEEFGPVEEQDWSIPFGGREVRRESKVHHHRSEYHTERQLVDVPYDYDDIEEFDCSRDLGNGYIEEKTCSRTVRKSDTKQEWQSVKVEVKVPVYQTWYTYEIDKWHLDHTETLSQKDQVPEWPSLSLNANQRAGRHYESYLVYFSNDSGKDFQKQVDYNTWRSLATGQAVILEVNRAGMVLDFKLTS